MYVVKDNETLFDRFIGSSFAVPGIILVCVIVSCFFTAMMTLVFAEEPTHPKPTWPAPCGEVFDPNVVCMPRSAAPL